MLVSLQVSKDGQGMVNVWQQQVQQFRNVSRDMAAAIVAEYPSPQLLMRAYHECQSVQDAMLLLQDILVRLKQIYLYWIALSVLNCSS